MKGKKIAVAELQEEINKRLAAFNGRKYAETEFHSWYSAEIGRVFDEYGIKDLQPTIWGIVTDMSEAGISFFAERVAEVNIDFKRDKRFKHSVGRGVILSMAVAFRAELLPLTLDEARRFLFCEKRDEIIKRVTEIRDNAAHDAKKAEEELARLHGLEF